MPSVLLVGEANPYGGDYLRRFSRANLCARAWSQTAARHNAASLLQRPERVFVLLGRWVAAAFAKELQGNLRSGGHSEDLPPFTSLPMPECNLHLIVLPHPSGLCREWNVPGAVERARAVMRGAGALP